MIWRFSAAPENLRSLHISSVEPEWLVLVPPSIHDPVVVEAIIGGAESVCRYEAPGGGVVYVGMSSADLVAESLASLPRAAPKSK